MGTECTHVLQHIKNVKAHSKALRRVPEDR